MDLDQAINIAKKECNDPYAQTYLRAIPKAIELDGKNALRVQLLYVMNNMRYWRGETAREVKKTIKAYLAKTK